MPDILSRLVSQLKAKGKSEQQAQAIARSTLERSGSLRGGKLTEKGKHRSAMGAAGRAKDRAAKVSGHKASDYKYNQMKNTARLKK